MIDLFWRILVIGKFKIFYKLKIKKLFYLKIWFLIVLKIRISNMRTYRPKIFIFQKVQLRFVVQLRFGGQFFLDLGPISTV